MYELVTFQSMGLNVERPISIPSDVKLGIIRSDLTSDQLYIELILTSKNGTISKFHLSIATDNRKTFYGLLLGTDSYR